MKHKRQSTFFNAVLLIGFIILSGCTVRVEEENVLPWFKFKMTRTRVGEFSPDQRRQYYIQHDGVWKELIATNTASVLDSDNVLVSDKRGFEIVHKDKLTPTYLCKATGQIGFPPCGGAIDIPEATFDTDYFLRRANVKRIDFSGKVLETMTISSAESGRVFKEPIRIFCYDDRSAPYFCAASPQAMNDWNHMPGDYALITVYDGHAETWAAPPEMTASDSLDLSNWQKVVPRRLVEPSASRKGRMYY